MAKGKTLADLVAAGVAAESKRQTWWELLPDEARQELTAVREQWLAGGYGRAKRGTVARILVAHCGERGWKTCDVKRLSEWLRSKS